MFEIYLVVTLVSGTPQITPFAEMSKACLYMESQAGSNPRIYKETEDRKNGAVVVEGTCKALMQFTPQGGK